MIRIIAKWTLTTLTILALAAWIGSGWWTCGWLGRDREVNYLSGRLVCVDWGEPAARPGGAQGWYSGLMPAFARSFRWPFEYSSKTRQSGATMRMLTVPGWALVLAFAASTAVAWRSDLRARGRFESRHPYVTSN